MSVPKFKTPAIGSPVINRQVIQGPKLADVLSTVVHVRDPKTQSLDLSVRTPQGTTALVEGVLPMDYEAEGKRRPMKRCWLPVPEVEAPKGETRPGKGETKPAAGHSEPPPGGTK